jgi:hypothetical protein
MSEDRRPVEVGVASRLLAPTCGVAASSAACDRGVELGGAALALHRASPYFAIGGEGALLTGTGRRPSYRTLELAVTGRVYLSEQGALEPYLELGFGYGSQRAGREVEGEPVDASRRGPTARVGGGIDLFVFDTLRAGLSFAYREAIYGPDRSCRVRRCAERGGAVGEGGLLLGVGLTLLAGDPL